MLGLVLVLPKCPPPPSVVLLAQNLIIRNPGPRLSMLRNNYIFSGKIEWQISASKSKRAGPVVGPNK